MKIKISVKYNQLPCYESFHLERQKHSVANAFKHHKKALRLVNALNKGGAKADFVIVPESAAELNRIVSKGVMMAKRIWHFSDITPSKAKSEAIKRWRNIIDFDSTTNLRKRLH